MTTSPEIRLDEATRLAAADDFGHLVHRPPARVAIPRSADDVAAAVRWAAAEGRTLAPRGRGHSVFGRSQAHDGVVCDMSGLAGVGDVQRDRVVVGGGATWAEVLAATVPRGRTPPVLTDYLDLSVGGTLVVGGVGGTTSRFGVQSDQVLELHVVTGRGEPVTCSPTSSSALFDAVRAGLGKVAVITSATLRLVAAPEQVRRFLLSYPDLATMLTDQRLLATDGRFDAVQGAIVPTPDGWAYRLDASAYFSGSPPDDDALLAGLSDDAGRRQPSTSGYLDYLNRLAPLETALRANGQWRFPHPWLTTFVGDAAVEDVVGGELARLTAADLGPFGQVVLSAFARDAVSSPLVRLPADRLCYAFNLIRVPSTDVDSEAARLVAANRAIYERVRDAGGTLYPVSAFPMSRDDWRGHFGAAFDTLSAARQACDPDGVLTPGYEV